MASRSLQQQVRAREMDYERQQAQKLKEKKEKRRQKLVDRLNELWREEQEARIAALAKECALALCSIGQSHAAAALFNQKQEALKMERIRQAELNQLREFSRFKVALQKERVRKKLESNPVMVAERRRKAKDFAAQWERSLGRFASHNAKFKVLSRPFSSGASCGWFEEHKEASSLLQPSDYKHTFLHSRLFINTGNGHLSSKDNEMDAWKAAELHRQAMNSYRIMQMEIRSVMNKRKALRGQLAGTKLMIEKKLQLLDYENLAIQIAEKETKRKTLRQHGVTSSKAKPEGVDEPLPELPKNVKANSSDLLDKTSGNIDESFDKQGKHEIPQGLTIISCSNDQRLHISASGENGLEIMESSGETINHSSTSIMCCKDIKICLDSSNDGSCNVACQKKSRKSARKVLSCKFEKKTERGQMQTKPRKPSNVSLPCQVDLLARSIKTGNASSEGKTKENKRVAHPQSGAQVKLANRSARIESILHTHDDSALDQDRKKKPELQAITVHRAVKVVKFKKHSC